MKDPQLGKPFPCPSGHRRAVLTAELIYRSSGTQPGNAAADPSLPCRIPAAFGSSTLEVRESLCCSLLGTAGAALGLCPAGRNVRAREQGRAVPGAGSGSARGWAQRRKTKLNFETELGGHPGGRVDTWHGVLEAAGSPGAAPRDKMRHSQQSNPSDLYFNVGTC